MSKETFGKVAALVLPDGDPYLSLAEELSELMASQPSRASNKGSSESEHVLEGSALASSVATLGLVLGAKNHFAPDLWAGVSSEELARVCLFAEVGKLGLYTPTDEAWKTKRGIFWDVNLDGELLGQDKTLSFLAERGLRLSSNEFQGIRQFAQLDGNYVFIAPIWHRLLTGLVGVVKAGPFPLFRTANETLEKLGLPALS